MEGNPPGTISAAFVLWATQLDQVRVHSDEFAAGTYLYYYFRASNTLNPKPDVS